MENIAPVMCAEGSKCNSRALEAARDYLIEKEIEKLIDAAGDNCWGYQDATAILIAYRLGLRASELVSLRWGDIDFMAGKLHVRRAKGGTTGVHPVGGRELRALRKLKCETPAST